MGADIFEILKNLPSKSLGRGANGLRGFYGVIAAKYEAYFRLLIRGFMSRQPLTKSEGTSPEPEPRAISGS